MYNFELFQVGFLYDSVVEDFLTGFILHCNGWNSVFCEPSRPQFLGTATTNLNDVLIQGTRWYSGLFENGISKFCPLIYGSLRMPLLQSLCFAELTYFPLYCLPLWCFATIPQLCLQRGIPLYPKVTHILSSTSYHDTSMSDSYIYSCHTLTHSFLLHFFDRFQIHFSLSFFSSFYHLFQNIY